MIYCMCMQQKAPTALKNQIVLNKLPGKVYEIEANDKIPDSCRYPFSIIKSFDPQAGLRSMTARRFRKR